MDINFGFEILSVAGIMVEEKKESDQEVQAKKPEAEFQAMKQEEILKDSLLKDARKIYSSDDIN